MSRMSRGGGKVELHDQGQQDSPIQPADSGQPDEETQAARAIALNLLNEHLSKSSVTPAAKKKYAAALAHVVERMPRRAAELVPIRVHDTVFHSTVKKLTKAVSSKAAREKEIILGAWVQVPGATKGNLHLDGDSDESKMLGTYAHEMGHVVDVDRGSMAFGRPARISDMPEWREAWQSEIVENKPLSDYATESRDEGFAEFARVAWLQPEVARSKFPKCWAIFQKHGLI